MESYTTIQFQSKFEYEDRKSVFIGEALPVSSEEDALKFIAYIKKKYSDARHHVYAYVLRDNSIMRFSDDREPQGTAGMPVLDVIRKNGCTDTVIVVTRYFGGTLLGTGGLVKAYTSAALGALKDANIITYDLFSIIKISVSYSDYQKIATALDRLEFYSDDTKYSDVVTVLGKTKKNNTDLIVKNITETTSGRGIIEILEEKFDFIS
ncbi:MAG: YigZ family protein [Ruminococcaceae bacterium]|nr:YigZ family protein [Oscillospiraceae bacterium]